MGKSYRPYYPDEDLLLPPSLRDWLPEKHLAYFVSDVVDHLDLSAMEAVYGNEKRGQPPYDPQMMTKCWYTATAWVCSVPAGWSAGWWKT